MLDPADFLRNGKLIVLPDTYSIIKSMQVMSDCFACIADSREITLIAKTGLVDPALIIEEEPGWKVLTFDMVLPFGLTGFLAVVSSLLAENQIPIFAISAYSTDHILVKADRLDESLEILTTTGISIVFS